MGEGGGDGFHAAEQGAIGVAVGHAKERRPFEGGGVCKLQTDQLMLAEPSSHFVTGTTAEVEKDDRGFILLAGKKAWKLGTDGIAIILPPDYVLLDEISAFGPSGKTK